MSKSTKKHTLESSNGQTNAEENPHSRNYSLIHREKVPNTPFEIVGNEETGYFLALGRYKLSQPTPTIDEAYAKLIDEQWNIILNLVTLTHEVILNEMASKTPEK